MPDWSADIADRVRALNDGAIADKNSAYVLCRLQQTLRAWDNPAIDAAIELGNRIARPVLVCHGIREDDPYASDRLHHFLLYASRDAWHGCAERGLRCANFVDRAGRGEKGLVFDDTQLIDFRGIDDLKNHCGLAARAVLKSVMLGRFRDITLLLQSNFRFAGCVI